MHSVQADTDRNLASMLAFVEHASAVGTDVVCFPEMSLTGYIDPLTQADSLMSWDDDGLSPLLHASARLRMTLVVGIAERREGDMPFIAQGVIRAGALAGVYRKINVALDEIDRFSCGSEPLVFSQGATTLGIGICADDSSLFKDYAARGASVVLLLVAPGLDGPQASRD
jgi:predicted amidohydrolase